jgi:enoyl-CoA hydratase
VTPTPAADSGMHFEIDAAQPRLARLTLRNPGRLNAVTRAMWRQLREIFSGLAEREPALRVVIVRGEGGHFAAGADLAEFPSFHFDPAAARAFHEDEPAPALQAMLDCDIPLVAQIDGACVGGGLEIAACCDLRIAGTNARFGAPIAKLGFPMAPDELAILLPIVGRATLAEMLLEARLFDAATALQRGLVQRVVDDAVAEAEATARRIAALPGLAARINKQTMRQFQRGGPTPDERTAHFRYAATDEHRDGVTRFLDKRR